MTLPNDVLTIINTLNANGFEAYAVGGCVRDFSLGKTPKDYDITTNAEPQAVKRLFRRTADTGLKHGTVTVIINKKHIEVTTYRIDGEYTDNRRPDSVIFTRNLKDDLLRRDFTINAMAYHPQTGLTDFYEGREDLKNKIIRCVGEPGKRFSEDALRMLRALRFAAQLGFNVEDNTKAAVYKNAALIKNISAERIRDELLKMLAAPCPDVFALLADTRILRYFSPALDAYLNGNLPYIISNLKKLPPDKKSDRLFTLAAFFCAMPPKDAKKQLTALKLDNRAVKEVYRLVTGLNAPLPDGLYETRKTLSQTGADTYERLIALKGYLTNEDTQNAAAMFEQVIANGDCFTLAALDINGADIMELGAAGKKIGDILSALLDTVMQNPGHNTREYLTQAARHMI